MSTINSIEQRNNISIAILGRVSCGKSTLLNSIYVKKYADMKMKRATMLPFVYKEANKDIMANPTSTEIYNENIMMNAQIYSESTVLTNENCKEISNLVPGIENFLDLPENVFLDIYDIPGLDDATTHEIYFNWGKENFYKFDIIIHVVDIQMGLNTEGEVKILDFITDCIKIEKEKNGRNVPMFTLINKCDDMNYNADSDSFEFVDEELEEMYQQIVRTTENNLTTKNMSDIEHPFIPFSAIDTYIYRMLDNDPDVELDMKLLNKFGQNELGKTRWNRASEKTKKAFIKDHFAECDINETLEMTGYNKFKGEITKYLNPNNQYRILVERLKYELSQESVLSKNITRNIDDMKELIKLYNDYSSKINVIDETYNKQDPPRKTSKSKPLKLGDKIYGKQSRKQEQIQCQEKNNKELILNIIIGHIEKWVETISDISNESEESIERLNEYKEIFSLLSNNISKDSLTSKISLVNTTKFTSDKWLKTLDGVKIIQLNSVSTLGSLLSNIKRGYSSLQNTYYTNKLLTGVNAYDNFPTDVYDNLDKLNMNDYDNMEKTITDVNEYILSNIKTFAFSPGHLIYSGYSYINSNVIIQYCDTLIDKYDYPKEKLAPFIHTYILNRYHMHMNTPSLHMGFAVGSDNENMFYAHTYLLDAWLSELSSTKNISSTWKNLYIINKSYCNYPLNPFLYYCKDDILALPIYLKELENINDNDSDMSDYEDVKPFGARPLIPPGGYNDGE